MAPLTSLLAFRNFTFDPSVTSDELRDQWILPGDVFVVLLILGGDVVARALAQLTGHGLTPVAFSFGWVAYSVSALVSAVGANKLMPQEPDCKCTIINGKSQYTRENSSWILGRIMRDFDHWRHPDTKQKTQEVIDAKWDEIKARTPNAKKKPPRAGLVVSIYEPSMAGSAGIPTRDYVYWFGIFTIVVQLGIAAIPCALYGDWGILMITCCGTLLAMASGSLPQWKKEKWACRTHSKETYILTRGNGSQHAIIILGNGCGLNMEDLAAGQDNVDVSANMFTRAAVLLLTTFWILLLITAAGLRANTWFLLAIGGVGIIQNIFAAGWERRPENFGIHLDFVEVIGKTKVMLTLFEVEERYPHLGRSMRDEFFPNRLTSGEIKKWEELEQRARMVD